MQGQLAFTEVSNIMNCFSKAYRTGSKSSAKLSNNSLQVLREKHSSTAGTVGVLMTTAHCDSQNCYFPSDELAENKKVTVK